MMNLYEVARFLEAHDNYDILTHAYPTVTPSQRICTLPCAPPNRQKSKSYHNRCSVKVYLSSEKHRGRRFYNRNGCQR